MAKQCSGTIKRHNLKTVENISEYCKQEETLLSSNSCYQEERYIMKIACVNLS